MRPTESFLAQPVRSLQTMLRVIGENDPLLPGVIPDGFYGPNTVTALSAFQRKYGLPVTGVADQSTWDLLVPVYQDALVSVGNAEPLQVVLNPGQILRRGQRHPVIWLAQAILTVLAEAYAVIPFPGFTGVLDLPTAEALAAFQRLSLLPDTGELDKQTWRHLALQYPMAANLLTQE